MMTEGLRHELIGRPMRVCEIAAGMVIADVLSLDRSEGNWERADADPDGVERSIAPEKIADIIAWVASRPALVDVGLVVVRSPLRRLGLPSRHAHLMHGRGRRVIQRRPARRVRWPP
jgi:NADP-dependent 3-hydroxy acid dehydrogenase YdfG